MTQNFYRVGPRQAREYIVDAVEAGLVPFVRSSPGCGKSSIMRSVGDEFGLKLVDHRLSTSAPEDLSGLPEFYDIMGADNQPIRSARFVPFADIFPVEGMALPKDSDGDDMEGWMLFFDEFNSGSKEVQAAC